jgi:hypothetical protein
MLVFVTPPHNKRDKTRTIVVVITYNHLLDLAKLAHLTPEVLVEGIEMVLQLCGRHLKFGIVGWVLVEVRKEDGLRVGGFDVFARASVTMSAGADFVVKRAVDFVLFGTEDRCEVVGHDCCGCDGIGNVWSSQKVLKFATNSRLTIMRHVRQELVRNF